MIVDKVVKLQKMEKTEVDKTSNTHSINSELKC